MVAYRQLRGWIYVILVTDSLVNKLLYHHLNDISIHSPNYTPDVKFTNNNNNNNKILLYSRAARHTGRVHVYEVDDNEDNEGIHIVKINSMEVFAHDIPTPHSNNNEQCTRGSEQQCSVKQEAEGEVETDAKLCHPRLGVV